MKCTHCGGTGIEPSATRPGFKTDRWGQSYRLDASRVCPVCGAPLMLGDPVHRMWHCSATDHLKGQEFMEHFERSIVRASQRSGAEGSEG